MGVIIAITNNKGGVGKTTTAVNFGAGLRLRGYNVLLIDLDGQSNLTITFPTVTVEQSNTTYALMKSCKYVQPQRVLTSGAGCGVLDVLPSCVDLSACEVELATAKDRITRLGELLNQYRNNYDFIIIDTPPTLGLLSISALVACDESIITLQPHYLAVRGLVELTNTINALNTNRQQPIKSAVLFTMYDKRKGIHRMTVEQVNSAGIETFQTVIRDNVSLVEAPATGTDIFRYNPKCNGAEDYGAFVNEYLKRCKSKPTRTIKK